MHLNLNAKKIFLFGFIAVLLIGIPVTVYLVQQQQNTKSRAAKSTTLSFVPDSSASAPIQKNVGDSIPLDITVDPGTNLVSFVKLEISYDPDKLATASAGAFVQNSAVFPSILEGPVYTPGKISVTLSVGSDPTKAIQTKVKAATVTFKALSSTPAGTPTLISYGSNTQVLSVGSNDQASENVLSASNPAAVAITGTSVITPSPSISITLTPTATPTVTPTPTVTITPTATPTATLTPTVTGTSSTNTAPVCSTLTVDRTPIGDAPLTLTFTGTGSDANGTISKVTFNFGDGGVSDITTGGGIGTASVNASVAHTYNSPGTFTASAVLTDNGSAVSDSASCKQTITVTASSVTVEPTAESSPAPTIAATGSTETALGIGAVILIFILGGGFLFFLI